MDLNSVLSKARHSRFYLWLLNMLLSRMIPFNKPHGFRLVSVSENNLKVLLPYKRRNFNHIRGLHACALATASEFTTGFMLVSKLDSKKYRLIMQRLEMDYHYQGKTDAFAEFSIDDQWIDSSILDPLRTQESVVVICTVKVHDINGNHLTTGQVYWQIKDWSRVRTRT